MMCSRLLSVPIAESHPGLLIFLHITIERKKLTLTERRRNRTAPQGGQACLRTAKWETRDRNYSKTYHLPSNYHVWGSVMDSL